MQYTTRLNLAQPESTDTPAASIAPISSNFGVIDGLLSYTIDTYSGSGSAAQGNNTETKILNGTTGLIIPANTIEAGDILRVRLGGEILQTTAGSLSYTMKFYFGTSVALQTQGVSIANNTSKRGWEANIEVVAISSSSQRLLGNLLITPPPGTAGTWIGALSAGGSWIGAVNTGVDLTTETTVNFSAQIASGTTSATMTCLYGRAERVGRL